MCGGSSANASRRPSAGHTTDGLPEPTLRSAAIQSDRAPTRRVSISHAYGLPAIVAARGGRRGFGEKSLTTTLLSLSNGDERMTYRRVSRNRQQSR